MKQRPTSEPGRQMSHAESLRMAPGTIIQDCEECPTMIVIPAGNVILHWYGPSFDRDERLKVSIRSLAISKFEITNAEWDICRRSGSCDGGGVAPPDDNKLPVVFVTKPQAEKYTNWLSRQTGKKYRLLSEAEWTYAARAGATGMYGFDGDISEICKHGNVPDRQGPVPCSDGYVGLAPVGMFMPNSFGLYDMIGNASEWVADCYHESLRDEDPEGKPYQRSVCQFPMAKGSAFGSWGIELEHQLRIDTRYGVTGERGGNGVGLRVARELDVK